MQPLHARLGAELALSVGSERIALLAGFGTKVDSGLVAVGLLLSGLGETGWVVVAVFDGLVVYGLVVDDDAVGVEGGGVGAADGDSGLEEGKAKN